VNTINKNKIIACIIPVTMLSLAIFDGLPYGFFTILRFIVSISAIYLAWLSYEYKSEQYWIIVFIIITILFNPIIPIYLTREIWIPIDIITGIFFLAAAKFFKI
jgi:hypothetical protein